MDARELAIHIENTKAYIDHKPSSIALTPVTRTPTASGGYKTEDATPRSTQTFRIIEIANNTSSTPPVLTTTDGKQRSVEFMLLGLPTAVVAVDDHWTADGREWRVGDVVRSNLYEIRALVVERGK